MKTGYGAVPQILRGAGERETGLTDQQQARVVALGGTVAQVRGDSGSPYWWVLPVGLTAVMVLLLLVGAARTER